MSGGVRVSVITPVYNDPDGLRKLIPTLRNQTLEEPYEVVFVDNDSTDETPRVLRERTRDLDRFRWVEYPDRQGSYAARNEGIRRAGGDVLAFTDADCRPRSNWLRTGLRCLEEEGVDLVAGRMEMTHSGEDPNAWEYLDSALHLNQERYAAEGWGATANLFVHRSVFDEHGLFDATRRTGGDTEFGRRVTGRDGRIAYGEGAVVVHPARRTFREFVEKELRLARGSDLPARSESVNPRDFLPAYWLPEHEDYDPSTYTKAKVLFGANLVRWFQAWFRWRREGRETR